MHYSKYVDIVFDGPPGPQSRRFIEAENDQGCSVSVGRWVQRPNGYWALRIHPPAESAMLVGLIRAAALLESAEHGRIWDDEAREALDKARALGLVPESWAMHTAERERSREVTPDAVIQERLHQEIDR